MHKLWAADESEQHETTRLTRPSSFYWENVNGMQQTRLARRGYFHTKPNSRGSSLERNLIKSEDNQVTWQPAAQLVFTRSDRESQRSQTIERSRSHRAVWLINAAALLLIPGRRRWVTVSSRKALNDSQISCSLRSRSLMLPTCQVNSHDARHHHELNAGAQRPSDLFMRRLRNIQLSEEKNKTI